MPDDFWSRNHVQPVAVTLIDPDMRQLDADTRKFMEGVGWGTLGGSALWGLLWVVWRLI